MYLWRTRRHVGCCGPHRWPRELLTPSRARVRRDNTKRNELAAGGCAVKPALSVPLGVHFHYLHRSWWVRGLCWSMSKTNHFTDNKKDIGSRANVWSNWPPDVECPKLHSDTCRSRLMHINGHATAVDYIHFIITHIYPQNIHIVNVFLRLGAVQQKKNTAQCTKSFIIPSKCTIWALDGVITGVCVCVADKTVVYFSAFGLWLWGANQHRHHIWETTTRPPVKNFIGCR